MKIVQKYRDLAASIIMLTFAIVVYCATYDIQDTSIYAVGPRVVPQLVTILMMLFSVICLVSAIVELVRKKEVDVVENVNYKAALAVLFVLCTYVYLFSRIGFIIDSVVALFLMFCILEDCDRKYLKYALISIISVVVIYSFFRYVLNLMLPTIILK